MPANLLGRETSPYLLQHRDNPVHWMPWGEEAFERARREGKPVLLSVGYAACHWCHVMAHECFEDDTIAGLMNALFVNIKVDREERPDVDQIYQSALALLGQPGGWPLTMFLTADGNPFWGGTYFPPAARYGRPGFPDVLRGVAETYAREPEKVVRNVTALREALEALAENRSAGAVAIATIDHVAERLVREVDSLRGGIGGAPKFPQVPILELFWRAWQRTGRQPFRQAVVTTLTRMGQGGIYDHLGGGFARYSVDEDWLVPHFEKMLYDNAQLLDLMTLVWQETREPLFEARVRETAAWVLREMVNADSGGFAATIDADSDGEEGLFYVWGEAEVDRLLGPDAALFKRVYGVTASGNWEGVTILNRLGSPDLLDPGSESTLAGLRERLRLERETRVHPGWDDKVLADWNGLMITALANAGAVFGEESWIAAARRAFDGVVGSMTVEGRLRHAWRAGQLRHPATLDDYAHMARGALALFEATGDAALIDQARAWVDVLDRHYWDAGAGGYFFTAGDSAGLIVRTKTAGDAAVPSGNGAMVHVLARLHALTGEDAYRDRAEALVAAFSGELNRNFFPLATFLNGVELLQAPLQIVVAGPPDDPRTAVLRRAVLDRSLPNRILTVVPPERALPAGHPAHGKGMLNGAPTAYVCVGPTCSAPATTPDELAASLERR